MKIKPIWGYTFMFGVTIGLIVLMAIAAEMYVRTFMPQSVIPRYVTNGPHGIRVNYPNIDVWHTTPEYRVNVRTNSQNMRSDREFTYEKPEGVKRIVALGDSFTYGVGVNIEDHYLTLVEKHLNESGIPVEIINFGVPGYSNAEELVILENEALRYDPDMILVAYYQNDQSENVISDLYAISNGELVKKNDEYLPAVRIRNVLYSIPIYRFLAERSNLLYLVREMASNYVYELRLRRNQEASVETLQAEESSVNGEVDYKPLLTAKIIDRFYEVSQEEEIPLVLLDIPWDTLITQFPKEYMEHFDDLNYFESGKVLEKDYDEHYLYWKKSMWHWTPYAHDQVAAELAGYIMENDFLRDSQSASQ